MAETLSSAFTNIANAIRGKNRSHDTYTPAEMVTAIENLDGGETILEPVTVTENGTVTPPSGHAYNSITVNVEGGGSGDPEQGIVTIPLLVTENGTYTAPSGVAYSSVVVDVLTTGPKTRGVIIATAATAMGVDDVIEP